jgi:hypothetical protein
MKVNVFVYKKQNFSSILFLILEMDIAFQTNKKFGFYRIMCFYLIIFLVIMLSWKWWQYSVADVQQK